MEDRVYQRVISEHALRENVLVVLPTALGKTAIAMRAMAEWVERYPNRSLLFLAPTRPLVQQHAHTIETFLNLPPPAVLTGTITPEKRKALFAPPQVVVATPQVIRNDVETGALSLDLFSMIVFDEAHRAVGDYPYVDIAMAFKRVKGGRTIGITASPGNRIERVREVMENIGVTPSGLEVRDGSESDVEPYRFGIAVEPVYVDNPRVIGEISGALRHALERRVAALGRYWRQPQTGEITTSSLLEAGRILQAQIARFKASGGVPADLWQANTQQAVAMKLNHAIELVETQGVNSLERFVERMRGPEKRRSPSTGNFLGDPDVRRALTLLASVRSEHPKIGKTVELVRDELVYREGGKVIVFAQYRDMAELLVDKLRSLSSPQIRPVRFVGQATKGVSDKGLKQKEQVAILEDFRNGTYNCLVATSVAEEGLDVPDTDLVIFYESVPSEIRYIQRRGRTGRARAGKVVVLLTRGTKDIASHYSSRNKEWKMKRMIEELKGTPVRAKPARTKSQLVLDNFP
jgi:Fanconi anemia group M protein